MDLLDLIVKIKADSSGYDKAVDAAEGKAHSFGKVAGKAFATMGAAAVKGAAVAGGALSTLAGLSLHSFAEYEQLVGGAQLMFGDAYDFVADKAANAYATVQMSQNDYLTQVNGFATGLKTSLGGNVQAAAELADKIVTAEADVVAATGNSQEAVQNAFNGIMKSNFTMLDNLQLGIKPTKEGMQEVIDKVNDWNKANGKATSYQIDNLADCQSALVDYIEMQGVAGYAANEAADTIEGSAASMKAAFANLLTGFADESSDLSALTQQALDAGITYAGNVIPRLATIFGRLFEIIPQYLGEAYDKYMPIVMEKVPEILNKVIEGIKTHAPAVIDRIGALLSKIGELLKKYAPVMLKKGYELILKLAQAIADKMPVIIGKIASMMGELLKKIMAHLPQILAAGGKIILTLLGGIVNSIPALLSGMVDIGKQMLQGLWEGITSMTDWIWSKISGFFNNTIVGGIKKLLGIHSPSRVFAEIGDYCVKGLEEGMKPISDGSTIKNALKGVKGGLDIRTSVAGVNGSIELAKALRANQEDQNYTINLITTLDGKTIASSTAKYTQAELDKRERRANRLQGVRA